LHSYFGNSSANASTASNPSRAALSKLFDKYRDDPRGSPDTISITGSMAYFTAIGAELDDIACLIASEIVQCPSMGEITRDGFVNGWKDLGGDTIEAQKRIVASRRQGLGSAAPTSRQLMKAVYKHTFKLGITSAGQRSVDKETCMEFWKMLFAPPSFDWRTQGTNWLALWLEFVASNNVKGINSDVWNQTLVFAAESVKDETLAWWSEEAAWPALVDEFVEWSNEKRGVKKADADEEMEY
jgi:DCN1-like protein 1/2